jgi:hypothetical protein
MAMTMRIFFFVLRNISSQRLKKTCEIQTTLPWDSTAAARVMIVMTMTTTMKMTMTTAIMMMTMTTTTMMVMSRKQRRTDAECCVAGVSQLAGVGLTQAHQGRFATTTQQHVSSPRQNMHHIQQHNTSVALGKTCIKFNNTSTHQ